jgi:hypothetical protein
MERGELLNLRWEYVDLRLGVAHLPLTKNGDNRDNPVITPRRPGAVGTPRQQRQG